MKHSIQPLLWMAALVISISCAHKTPNDPPSSSGEPPSIATRDASQRLASQEAIGEEAPTSRDNEFEQTKNRDEARVRRANEFSRQLSPELRQLREHLRLGEWQAALNQAEHLEALWATSGIVELKYAKERAEAHIGLGNPEEAVRIFQDEVQPQEKPGNLTLALALAMTDQLDGEAANAIAEWPLRYFTEVPLQSLPPRETRDQKIAFVRTARAIDAEAGAQDLLVIREAREALRLDPSQKLAAYVLAEAAGRQNLKAEALASWQIASTLPGRYGKKAREMVRSYSHQP